MNAELFGKQYLSAAALEGVVPANATIRQVKIEEIGNDEGRESKMVLYLNGLPDEYASKGLILNVTNRKILVQLFGSETDKWIGQTVRIEVVPVQFGGRIVQGIRLGRA